MARFAACITRLHCIMSGDTWLFFFYSSLHQIQLRINLACECQGCRQQPWRTMMIWADYFSLSLSIYIYMYMCVCVYIYTYTHIYILGVLLYADLRGGRDYFLFLFGFRQIRVCIFRGERYYYQKGTNRLFVHKGVRHVHMHINRKFWAPRKVSHLVCGFKTQIPNSSPRL